MTSALAASVAASVPRAGERAGAVAAGTRLLAGLAAGLAIWASFPPLDLWPLAPVGVAGLVLAVRGARLRLAAAVGLAAGLGLFLPLLSWLRVIGVDAWAVVALSQALWLAALAVGLRLVAPLPGWPAWSAALWVAEELGRDRLPFGGFTWGRLAFGQADAPTLGYAALGGAPLVSFVVALAGAALAYAVVRRRSVRPAVAAGLGAVALLALGLAVPRPVAGQAVAGRPASVRVAVVQGNVPRLGLDEFQQARGVVRDHAAVATRLAGEVAAGTRARPDLVVWPENSSDFDPYRDPTAYSLIDNAVRAVGAPTMVGAVLAGPGAGHARNASIVWSPQTGPGAVYLKRHLVPFGEYMPFRGLLRHLSSRVSLVPDDFIAGHRPGVLQVGPARVADVICFEVAFDGVVRDAVNGGGRLLVVQTNDATYEHPGDSGYGGESAQQLAITRLRAVEHGRAAVVAATSGVSAIVAPDGRVLARSGVFRPAILERMVPLRSTRTLADRVGAAPEWALGLVGIGAALAGALRARTRRAG